MTRPRSEVVARRLDDRTVVVNLQTNRIYELNRTGSRLWELLEDGLDRPSIERKMLDEFNVDGTKLAGEIDRILLDLSAKGLTSDDGHG
jgi:hypothetical protein